MVRRPEHTCQARKCAGGPREQGSREIGSNSMLSYSTISVHVTFLGLIEALVGDHFLLKLKQDAFHVGLPVPVLEQVELGGLNAAVVLVNGGNVDLGSEANLRRLLGVVGSGDDGQEVDATVELRVSGADNRGVPVLEVGVVGVVQTIGDGLVSEAFLALLKLVKQSEETRL